MFRVMSYPHLKRKLVARNPSFGPALDMIREVTRMHELLTKKTSESRVVDYWNNTSTLYSICHHQPGFILVCILKKEVRLSRGIKTPDTIRRMKK